MSSSGTDSSDKEYEKQLSEIIQGEIIDLYGGSKYNSLCKPG